MNKQQSSALNVAKFIQAQTLILLEKLDVLDLDIEANACEQIHEQAEALHQRLAKLFAQEQAE